MINVFIISGFLGSGKTTLIQKLIKEKDFKKPMLLENEFGEVNIDKSFFSNNLAVSEINNGCICCSLKGDFKEALNEISKQEISDLIIEPSGIGKLSEIIDALKENDSFDIVCHICMVDVKTCKKYHLNYQEYFDDQVKHAGLVILSHVDVCDLDAVVQARDLVLDINPYIGILDEDYATMNINELLDYMIVGSEFDFGCCKSCCEDEHCCCEEHHHECCFDEHECDDDCDCGCKEGKPCTCHERECCCDEEHCCCDDEDEHCCCEEHHHECCFDEHECDDDCDCGCKEGKPCTCHERECCCEEHHHKNHHEHHHHVEGFETCTLYLDQTIEEAKVLAFLNNLDSEIIRCKGYVNTEKGSLYINYILNEVNTYYGDKVEEGILVFIAKKVDEETLRDQLNG